MQTHMRVLHTHAHTFHQSLVARYVDVLICDWYKAMSRIQNKCTITHNEKLNKKNVECSASVRVKGNRLKNNNFKCIEQEIVFKNCISRNRGTKEP